MDYKKLKAMIKNPAPKSTFGTDPNDPWSAKANINETKMLDQYLSTKGVNPKYAPKNLKVAHSKTNAFKKWARDHYDAVKKKEALKGQTLQLQGEETEQLDELRLSTLMRYNTKAHKSSHEHGVKAARAMDHDDKETWAKHANKRDQRDAGIVRSRQKMDAKLKKEETEQLDELAPKTLRSYIRKSYNEPSRAAGYARANEKHGAALEKELASRKASGKTIHTLGSITRKLRGEEVEQIDEISKKTALSYLVKSGKEIEKGSKTPHKRDKRIDGYFRAGDRLANLKKTSGPGISMGGPGKLSTEEKEADYGKNYQAMVQRVKAKAAQKPVDMASLAARMQSSYKKDDEKKTVKEGVLDSVKRTWKKISDFDDSTPKYDGNTKRRQALRDKLKKKPVKEDAEQLDEISKETVKKYKDYATLSAVGRASNIYDREVEGGKKPDPEMHRKLDVRNKGLARADARLNKEDTEQIDEISKDLANRYYFSARHDDNNRWKAITSASNKQSKEFSPERHKRITRMVNKSTKRGEGIGRALDRLQKEESEQLDEWENTKSKRLKDLHKGKDSGIEATGTEGWKQRKAQEMSKSARMVKALYKHHKVVKEDMYDHEKGDKAPATYGKAPKHDKADPKDSQGENKPKAAAVLTGGTTLTGEKRDDVEIDPMMRARPGQPDPTKKKDGDKDKDDKKKDK